MEFLLVSSSGFISFPRWQCYFCCRSAGMVMVIYQKIVLLHIEIIDMPFYAMYVANNYFFHQTTVFGI